MTRRAVAAIIKNQEKYLLIHKILNSDNAVALQDGNVWDFLKGGVENGESNREALRREISEEISLKDFRVIGEVEEHLWFEFPKAANQKYENQETVFYVVEVNDLTQVVPDGIEIDKFIVLSKEQVLEKLTYGETREFFRRYLELHRQNKKIEPDVSVIMPVYNRAQTLRRAAESVLHQSVENFELWIVDDGSTDDTSKIMKQLQNEDSRVKIISNSHSKGVSGARNTALEHIQGEYIAFLDSDDEWDHTFLEASLTALEKTKVDVTFCLWTEQQMSGSGYKIFSADFARKKLNKGLNQLKPRKQGCYYIFEDRRFYEYVLTESFYCFHINTTFLKSNIVKKEGIFFDEQLVAGEDLDFVTKIIKLHKSCLIEEFHYYHNQGTDNLYNFKERDNNKLEAIILDRELVRKFTDSDKYKIEMLKKRIEYVKSDAEFSTAKKCIQNCRNRIGRKYFTLGLLNQHCNRKLAISYLWHSLFYDFHGVRFSAFVKLINPFRSESILADSSELYFY